MARACSRRTDTRRASHAPTWEDPFQQGAVFLLAPNHSLEAPFPQGLRTERQPEGQE